MVNVVNVTAALLFALCTCVFYITHMQWKPLNGGPYKTMQYEPCILFLYNFCVFWAP